MAALAPLVNLAGLQRWGYLVVAPDGEVGGAPPPRRDWLVRLTPAGRQAQQVWRPLAGEIEERWRDRLGAVEFGRLRAGLGAVAGRAAAGFPPYLPVSGMYRADPAVLDAGARAAAGLRPLAGADQSGHAGASPGAPREPVRAAPRDQSGQRPRTGPGNAGRASSAPEPARAAAPDQSRGEPYREGGVQPGARRRQSPGPPGTSPAGNAGGRPAGDRGASPAGDRDAGRAGGPGTRPGGGPGPGAPAGGLGLPALLSTALLSWRLEYEQEAGLALPVSANCCASSPHSRSRCATCPPWPGYPRKRSRCRSACWSAAATR